MDPDLPPGMGGFFPGMLGDLLKLLRTDSPLQWDLALQLAQTVAADGEPEANVEPVDRIRLEELVAIAELHVADITGMTTTPSGRRLAVTPTARADWARRSLEGWRSILERLATALTPAPGSTQTSADSPMYPEAGETSEELGAVLGQWASTIAPAMIAMQLGSLVGHLAQRTLGQYDLPLPRKASEEIAVIPANVTAFAADWSLPADDVNLWLAIRDIAAHTVISRPHVHARLESLLIVHAQSFTPDPSALESRLGDLGEAGDLAGLTRLLGEPGSLGQLTDTAESRRARAELTALVSAIEGYVEWVTERAAARVIGAGAPVREAMRRRRVERSEEERAAEALFGLRLGQEELDRGESFVRGVMERGGELELAKLWSREENLPTPSELDAPGLWIERVNLAPLD